ncbi:MAG: HAD hydrolase-like protein [Candidatus Peribacteria bacterium]|jgi:FMN phosphatase YigB (HAD superfamily)|nr:HAD hydrolase-like protein [Candidatus Peribacteria bacterium]
MVGDAIARDIEGGNAVGMKTIRINRHHRPDQGIRYGYQVNNTKELF